MQDIENKKYRVVITSPEMCLEHPKFSLLFRSPQFTKNFMVYGFDEAHCISQWGESFRKIYNDVGKLRSFFPPSVPFLAVSATLPPHVLSQVQHTLGCSDEDTMFINLGNNRANITTVVSRMRGAATDLHALDFVVDEALAGELLIRTIIFVNTRELAYKVAMHLKGLLPPERSSHVDFMHAGRSLRAKQRVMQEFREGRTYILAATEAAGMVSILLSLQYMADSL
jgi:superfamily II DNA helicase RecQ